MPESSGLVDAGPTFYAPQILVKPGRILLWGWAWEGASATWRTSRPPAGLVYSPSRANSSWPTATWYASDRPPS